MIPQPDDPPCHDPHCTNPRHCGRCGAHHVVAGLHEPRQGATEEA